MKTKLLATGLLATALVAVPMAPASAHGFNHGRDALFGIGAAVGAVALGAAMLATAPVRILADAASAPGPVYAEPSYPGSAPVYAAPAPVYAAPAPVYAAPVTVVYAAPAPVYAPAYGYAYYPGYYRGYGYGYRGYR
jgi:hypothetical protein